MPPSARSQSPLVEEQTTELFYKEHSVGIYVDRLDMNLPFVRVEEMTYREDGTPVVRGFIEVQPGEVCALFHVAQ
jgi:hypothetical protein